MTGQAFLSEANANWAVTAYPAATILVGQFVTISRSKFILFLSKMSLQVNFLLCCALIAVTAMGNFGVLAPASDPLRGGRAHREMHSRTHPYISLPRRTVTGLGSASSPRLARRSRMSARPCSLLLPRCRVCDHLSAHTSMRPGASR